MFCVLLLGGASAALASPRGNDAHFYSDEARTLLQQPPFAPTNVDLFTPQIYPEALPAKPAPPVLWTEQELKQQVFSVLCRRYHCRPGHFADAWRIRKAIDSVMDNDTIVAKIDDARLRATLAMLMGTPGAGAIDAIKSDVFSTVVFGVPPVNAERGVDGIAQVVGDGTGHAKIIMNEDYQYEDPVLLAPVLFHETLHQDPDDSGYEELIANALDSMIYGWLLTENASLAAEGTKLARRENTKLMALVNSRDAAGRIRLLSAQGDNVYPGSSAPPLPYFAFLFVDAGLGAETPGNDNLSRTLRVVTRRPIPDAGFNDATLERLDQNINLFSSRAWIRIAKALQLDVGL